MGSKSSKVKRTPPAKTKALTVPRIPQELVDEILDHLATDSDQCHGGTLRPNAIACLRACALVSKAWVQPCQRHLFHTIVFTPRRINRWLRAFPVPEESPACHIKNMIIWCGNGGPISEEFLDYTPTWFAEVDVVCILLFETLPPLRKRPFWRLPRSTSSLTIDTDVAIHVRVRDITAKLLNLDELSLSGSLVAMDKRELPGNDERLIIYSGHDGYNTISTTGAHLETQSSSSFTEVWIYCTRKHLPSAVGLAEACRKTLVKLSHQVVPYGRSHSMPSPVGSTVRSTNADTVS